MYKLFVSITLLVMLAASACGSSDDGTDLAAGADSTPEANAPAATPTAGAGSVVGTWWVTAIGGKAALAESAATLVFSDDGTLGGNASCNSYSAPYTTDGNVMTLGEIAATLSLCDPESNEQETAFLTVLNDMATYSIDGTVLTMRSTSGGTITASSVAPDAPVAPVAGSVVGTWAVSTIDGGATVAGPAPTLVFDEAGKLGGNTSCNAYSTTYNIEGDKIRLGEIAVGASLCDDAANQQERAFVAVLNDVAVVNVDGSTLTLQTAAGKTLTAIRG